MARFAAPKFALVVFAAGGVGLGCVPPRFQLAKDPPALPEAPGPLKPPELETQAVADVLDFRVQSEEGAGVTLPLSRGTSLGVALTGADPGTRARLRDEVLLHLLKRGVPITDLAAMPEIKVSFDRTTKKGPDQEEVRWEGSMDGVLPVADVVRPEYVLSIRVAELEPQAPRALELVYVVTPAARQTYATAYARLQADANAYLAQVEEARKAETGDYEAARAQWNEENDKRGAWARFWSFGRDGGAATAAEAHQRFLSAATSRADAARALLASTAPPDKWAEAIAARPKSVSVTLASVELWASLTHGDRGTTVWQGRFSKLEKTPKDAFDGALVAIVDALLGKPAAAPKVKGGAKR